MSNMVISKQISNLDVIEYHVVGLNDVDFFDSLLAFMQQTFHVVVINIDIGIYTKKAYLNSNGISLVLEHNDDIGNFFYSTDLNAHRLLENISEELELRLKDCPYE